MRYDSIRYLRRIDFINNLVCVTRPVSAVVGGRNRSIDRSFGDALAGSGQQNKQSTDKRKH